MQIRAAFFYRLLIYLELQGGEKGKYLCWCLSCAKVDKPSSHFTDVLMVWGGSSVESQESSLQNGILCNSKVNVEASLGSLYGVV